jgi:hypothetical protein
VYLQKGASIPSIEHRRIWIMDVDRGKQLDRILDRPGNWNKLGKLRTLDLLTLIPPHHTSPPENLQGES